MTKRRVLAVVLTALIAITLVSVTLGREIYAGRSPGLLSFGLIHFAGYLFFLVMPVEALIPVYQAEGHPGSTLVGLAVATAIVAQAIDYAIGFAVKDSIIHDLVGEKRFEKFKAMIEKWGGWAILLFNLFPLSSPNMILVAGLTRYSAGKALMFSLVGLFVKYIGMIYLFDATSWWTSSNP